ncbi:MAG: AarF/ABC1/UbiB kinase family protein [Pseudomonadota bacterium]|nr:AarF/ABC1/UbiB kinase family protein [Pseudomonadota bacterium]
MDDRSTPPRKPNKIKTGLISRTFTTAKLSARLGMGATKKLLNVSADNPEKAIEVAAKLVHEFDGMKGLMMKFGQMASYLGTHLPPEAREILATLQASSTAMAFEDVRDLIEAELNAPIENCFDQFEETAFAAASIGQVHKAVVNGKPVAVKVQYPGIETLLSMDLKLVGNLFTVFMAGTAMPGRAMAQELKARLLEECDYELEASNQLKIRALSESTSGEHIPAVVTSHSSRRVLTTEFCNGMSFQDFCHSASQAQKNQAGLTIFTHTMNAIFRHCYFNGDPHPGNYLFHPDGRVTFLDFGCIKKFDPTYINNWKAMAKSILEQRKSDNLKATDAMGLIGRMKAFDHDHHWEMMNHVYSPFTTEAPFTFTHEFNSKTTSLMIWENKNKFSGAMPADFLFINRLQWGLAAILADMGATARFAEPFRSAVYADAVPAFKPN